MSDEPKIWTPNLAPKGFEVFNCYSHAVLLAGGRMTSKTISAGHKVFRHLWETPGARVGLFAKTIKSAKDGGVWNDLIDIIAPEWMNSGMVGINGLPLEYTSIVNGVPGPKSDGATRTMYFTVRNMYGGNSELLLFSLDDEKYVEAKVKSLRFSMIWFSELSNFMSRQSFNVSIFSLRMPHLRFNQHQWIADTNPAKEGKDSWIYKLWYEDRIRKDHPLGDQATKKEMESWLSFQKGLHLIEFTLDDNPFIDPHDRMKLEGAYIDDPGEYARNVLGEWIKGKGGAEFVFADIFSHNKHIIPGAIDIPKDTEKMFTSWDLGSSRNSAAIIMEKRVIKGVSHWMIHEELVHIDVELSTESFAFEFYQKMIALEQYSGRKFQWKHWSDSSSTDVYRSASDCYDAGLVAKATDGRVELEGADKPKGSVTTSIKMIRMLLRENRFFVGENCPRVIEMLSRLEHGTDKDIDDGPLKHTFDAMRYCLFMELRMEIEFEDRTPSSRSALMSVG